MNRRALQPDSVAMPWVRADTGAYGRFAQSLLVSLTVVALAAFCPAATASSAQVVAGTVDIASARSATAVVRIGPGASLDLRAFGNKSVTFEGKAAAQLVILRRHDHSATPLVVGYYTYRPPGRSGCPDEGCDINAFSSEPAESVAVPPGDYDLMVAADSSAAVRLTLDSSGARSQLEPAEPLDAVVKLLPRLDPAGDQGNVAVFGSDETLSAQGFVAWALASGAAAGTASRFELCSYMGSIPEDAYTPTCPGSSDSFAYSDASAADAVAVSAAALDQPAGHYGLGGNILSASGLPSATGVGFWLSYPRESAHAPSGSSETTASRWVSLLARRVPVHHGRAVVRLRCEAPDTCRLRLRLADRVVKRRVPAGASRSIDIPVPRRILRRLRRHGPLRLKLHARDARGRQATWRISLRPA